MHKINCYPLIYKKRVCEYYFEHKYVQKISEIVKLFKIANGTLYNWINKYTRDILVEKKSYIKTSKYTPEIKCFIRSYIIKHIDFDYKKLITSIKHKYKLIASQSMIYSIINNMNITHKKFKKRIIPNQKNEI